MTDVIVTMRHMRQCKFCSSGVREFFKEHGLDWSKFLREGIHAETLVATNNATIMRAVELAREQT